VNWWTLEQTLAWIMWRDYARVGEAGDGRPDVLMARQLADFPTLTEQEEDEIIAVLLERGMVLHHWPDTSEAPYPGREKRAVLHQASGCQVALEGWRQRVGEPLCTDGRLSWQAPVEQPVLHLRPAMAELLSALRDGKVAAKGEIAPGRAVDITEDQWMYADLGLSLDANKGGHILSDTLPVSVHGVHRLRLERAAIKKLWHRPGPPREVTGAAAGKHYRDEVIDAAAHRALALETGWKKRTVTDDDIVALLVDLCAERDEDGGPHERTLKRWVDQVRERIAALAGGPS
jgi:hypothetical protein